MRQAARYFGVEASTILRWCRRDANNGWRPIPTRSSRPLHHPNEISPDVVGRILALRSERNQCAEILHWRLRQEGVVVSLSSVKRTLRRHHISRFSKWKKWHTYPERPLAEKPGILVELDSMHDGPANDRLSAYAMIDVCSRWAYAAAALRVNSLLSVRFVLRTQKTAPFPLRTIQSDNGSEFSKWFTKTIEHRGIIHRHSRVRTPTDNAHVERFIQTLQRECLNRIPKTPQSWQKEIPQFLRYYNEERPHMGLGMRTPAEVLRSY